MNGKNAWIPLLLLMPLSIGNVYVARRQVGNALFARWQFGGVAGDPKLCKRNVSWPMDLTTWANRPDLPDTVPDIVPIPPTRPPWNTVVIVPNVVPPCRGVCPPPLPTPLPTPTPLRPDTVGDVVIIEPIPPPWRPLVATHTQAAPQKTEPFDWQFEESEPSFLAYALLPLASLAGAASPTRANVTVAVVPEPGTLELLSTGIALLIPLGMFRRRRARRADSGAAERAD